MHLDRGVNAVDAMEGELEDLAEIPGAILDAVTGYGEVSEMLGCTSSVLLVMGRVTLEKAWRGYGRRTCRQSHPPPNAGRSRARVSARRLAGGRAVGEDGSRQALARFVTSSPWDAGCAAGRVRVLAKAEHRHRGQGRRLPDRGLLYLAFNSISAAVN